MKKFAVLIIFLLTIFFSVINYAIAASFDMSQLETDVNKDLFSYAYEDKYIFIDTKLSTEEMAFVHKNDSKHYYSTVYPDIIVIDHGTKEERAVPRLWIDYCSDKGGINAHTLELEVGKCVYSFSLNEPSSKQLKNNATRESYVVTFGASGLQIINDWYKATIFDNKVIRAKLISNTDMITFDIPEDVATALTFTFLLFKAAGGYDTIDNIIETPVKVTGISDATIENIASQYSTFNYGKEYIFDSFSIRFPEEMQVININDYKKGMYGNEFASLFDEERGTCLCAVDMSRNRLYVMISVQQWEDDLDILRTMGSPSAELENRMKKVLYSDGEKIPEGEEIVTLKTSTTNFLGHSYLQSGQLNYMLKYLWAHDGQTYYMSIDIGHLDNADVSMADLNSVLNHLETLNTL